VLRFTFPYTTADSSDVAQRMVALHQGAQSVVVWLGLLACLTLVPGVIFAGRVVGRRAPRLAAAATILLVLGIGMLGGRVAPLWAPVATIAAQPIHFLAAVIIGSHALDLVGWGLNTAGFAALSLAVLALTNPRSYCRPANTTARQRPWDSRPTPGPTPWTGPWSTTPTPVSPSPSEILPPP
jgi:hypothetical protein